jgi:hypothetical protein
MKIVRRLKILDCWLTLQAVSEFYPSTTRKRFERHRTRQRKLQTGSTYFHALPPRQPISTKLLPTRSLIERPIGYLATAAEAGCTLVLPEDMAIGALLSGVRIRKPFSTDGVMSELTRELLDI